jgi:hypothetical protein
MVRQSERAVRACAWLLLLILLVAAVVRFWGVGFGLPHVDCRPDETLILKIAIGFGSGDLNPHFFRYPTLHIYVLFGLFVCYFLFKMAIGDYVSASDLVAEFGVNPTNFYLISRFLSAILGVATVLVVYKIAKRLFGKPTALVASLFLSLAYLHVRDSHFGVTDVPLTFLVTCAVLFIVKSWEHRTARSYLYSGLLAGLATSTKYTAVVVVAPMLAVHFLNLKAERATPLWRFVDRRLVLFGLALILAFLVGTPFALVDRAKFLEDVLFEINHASTGHLINLGIGWWYHLRFSLFYGIGWPLLLASLAGMLGLAKASFGKAAVLFSFPLVYYVLVGKGYTVFVRYALPLVPFLCIAAALFVLYIGSRLVSLLGGRLGSLAVGLMMLLVVVPSLSSVVRFDTLLAKPDNRLVCTEWFTHNVAAGSSVYQSGSWAGKLQLQPTVESLEAAYERRLSEGGGRVLKARIDYLRQERVPGYDEWTYDRDSGKFYSGEVEQADLPQYVVLEESPLLVYGKAPQGIARLVDARYVIVKSFEVVDVSARGNLYDQQDAFYLPFAGFGGVVRPGPNLYVYVKR